MVLYCHKIVWKVYFFKDFLALLQILKDSNISEHEETKETVLSQTEETKPQPQMEKTCSCPPQGKLNKFITNGMWNKKCK